MKIIERLSTLRKLNRNPLWYNDDLFRMMCSVDLAKLAYERIKSKPGNMTPGDDGMTLDGVSMQELERLCSAIKARTYKPSPVRRKHIPKANGKLRPLGVPSPRDKIVQEMMREILEAIYDAAEGPTFSPQSHGFRPRLSCHTAMTEFTHWQGTTWLIEGDIKGFFDNIDHHVLIGMLRRRIKDERFINLVWAFLRAGIREENGSLTASKLGAPQGGILSPILANIYLHEFDLWVQKGQQEHTRGEKRRPNPQWRSLSRRRDRLLAQGKMTAESEENKAFERRMEAMPTVMTDDPDFCRVYYVRYADDWLIGVVGPKQLAMDLKRQASEFLAQQLKLELSEEKTLITHCKSDCSTFLGYRLSVGGKVKKRRVAIQGRRSALKRVTGWHPRIDAPVKDLVSKLDASGYCETVRGKVHFPCSKKNLVALEDHDIVMRFNLVWRGIYNYYCICNNAHKLSWLMYILQYSCLKTLSHRHRRSLAKTIAKHGVFPTVRYRDANGENKQVSFWRPPSKWQQLKSQHQSPLDFDVLSVRAGRVTRSRLNHPCAVCESEKSVEMHHVRALRKGNKMITNGFNRILSAINRKQVPLCRKCHNAVHEGKHDGMRLSQLAYV